ncbi:MAG TPA: flagellar biosynthetic protein FliR [Polyangiaceae bacterium]|nr:flagellar biosynthetic protein FliR [Polyangiaceae bacterium]
MSEPLTEVARAFAHEGVDLASLGLAWARATPAVTIVPAFGLRAIPGPGRAVLALGFAACIVPAVALAQAAPGAPALQGTPGGESWLVMALAEVLRGLPVALAAAIPLWAATMAGGVADALRGSQETASAPTVEGRASPLGVPLSLLASAIFLQTGGPARVAWALASLPPANPGAGSIGALGATGPWLAVAHDLTAGISLAVALGAPLLAASVVIEVAGALIARAASPAQIHALLAPVRALGMLGVLAIVVDRLAHALANAMP